MAETTNWAPGLRSQSESWGFHKVETTRATAFGGSGKSLGIAIGCEGRCGYVGKYSDPCPPKNLKKNQKIGIFTLLMTVLILVGCILIAIPGGIDFFSREINYCLNGDKKALFSIPNILKLVTALNQFQNRLRLILVIAMNQLLTFIDGKPV